MVHPSARLVRILRKMPHTRDSPRDVADIAAKVDRMLDPSSWRQRRPSRPAFARLALFTRRSALAASWSCDTSSADVPVSFSAAAAFLPPLGPSRRSAPKVGRPAGPEDAVLFPDQLGCQVFRGREISRLPLENKGFQQSYLTCQLGKTKRRSSPSRGSVKGSSGERRFVVECSPLRPGQGGVASRRL